MRLPHSLARLPEALIGCAVVLAGLWEEEHAVETLIEGGTALYMRIRSHL